MLRSATVRLPARLVLAFPASALRASAAAAAGPAAAQRRRLSALRPTDTSWGAWQLPVRRLVRGLASSDDSGAGSSDDGHLSRRQALQIRLQKENEVLASIRALMRSPPGGRLDRLRDTVVKKLDIDVEQGSVHLGLDREALRTETGLAEGIRRNLSGMTWVKSVRIDEVMSSSPGAGGGANSSSGRSPQLAQHIVTVGSCKGGVGKSTVAVNVAYALQAQGHRVGLLDADIYGPSLPLLVRPDSGAGKARAGPSGKLEPVVCHGMPTMSFGYLHTNAAILRGPMVSRLITQLITDVEWGPLDYLIIDTPPGTGDVHITLYQQLNVAASLIVTTPQTLSVVDTRKGIDMLHSLKVPTVGIAENMSYFDCEHGTRYELFGKSQCGLLQGEYGFPVAVALPLDPHVGAAASSGMPSVLSDPTSPIAEKYGELAASLALEIPRTRLFEPEIRVEGSVITISVGPKTLSIPARKLRLACQCALCVDEMTNEPRLDPERVRKDVTAQRMQPKGNYAVSILWTDNHHSIYPYDRLWDLVPEQ